MNYFDVIIIGAGASGLMCAFEAGARGRCVAVVEHTKHIGAKILISGGGYCNFTNINASSENYFSENPHFCKSALSRYSPHDFMSFLKKHDIGFREKKDGQMFSVKSAKEIVGALVSDCKSVGVKFLTEAKIHSVDKVNNLFVIKTNKSVLQASSVVVASGGVSFPELGATNFGHKIAKQFGIRITPLSPALTNFTLLNSLINKTRDLSGISLDVDLTCNGHNFRENILFTHTGLGGPAVMQATLYWNPGDSILINLVPDMDVYKWIKEEKGLQSHAKLKNALTKFFPEKFAKFFCELKFDSDVSISKISDKELKDFCKLIHEWEIIPKGTVGFDKAKVTRGGVATDKLSSKTMESKKVKGLYFVGEVVDVTGGLGGYNLQWAWSSGFAAGQYV